MKAQLIKSLLLLAGLAIYSHALFGIGGQYAPNLGFSIDGTQETVLSNSTTGGSLVLNQGSESGLMGFGGKFWIDAIPFIDLEVASNLQFKEYGASLDFDLYGDGTAENQIPLEVDAPLLGERTPSFVRLASDLTVKYPFFKFPPAVSILKLYVGG